MSCDDWFPDASPNTMPCQSTPHANLTNLRWPRDPVPRQLSVPSQPPPALPRIQAAAGAAQALQEHGWTPPNWVELAQGTRPNSADTDSEENAPRTRGWQQQATIPVHTAMSNELQAVIPPASQALLHSQAGPFASRAFTTIPYTTEFEYLSHLFRILLLRRFRLHLPLSARCCRCRRPRDLLGDHRARSMCSIRSLTSPRRPCGKGSSTNIVALRISTSTPCLGSTTVASRRSRMGCQCGGKPASSGYHPGIAPHQVR